MTKHWIILVSLALSIAGCMAVKADFGTVITGPTQLITTQTGNYLVRSGSLYGLPAPTGQGVRVIGNVTVVGPALLQDLVVEGCVIIDRANRVELVRVWVEGCPNDGLQVVSDRGLNQSCCLKLDHVMLIKNGRSGLHLENTADVFITMSEFENNVHYGIELDDSPTLRMVNSDVGGNRDGGIRADHDSGLLLLSNNQYGNNQGDDIQLSSTGNLLSNQEFIGPPGHCALRTVSGQFLANNNYGPRALCGE